MEALSTVGADVVWAPSNDDAYPVPATTRIDAGPVAHILEGATRPTHFAGVALVVTKALNLIRPEVALFWPEGCSTARCDPHFCPRS